MKMQAPDGKQRTTDAADIETMLRIIQSIPSPKAEPLKQWLARVGAERLAETDEPALAIARARRLYVKQGYTDDWIEKRLQGQTIRDELTQEWAVRGADEKRDFARLTDTIHTAPSTSLPRSTARSRASQADTTCATR
jgi:DNA-damage-inducible protein D